MVVTNHALERLKERLGIKHGAAERLCKVAFERGLKREDTDGALRRYLDALFYKDRSANNLRVYGEHVYIFIDDKLITVWGLDSYYKKLVKQHQQQQKGVSMYQTQGQQSTTPAFNPVIKTIKAMPLATTGSAFSLGKLIVALEVKHKINKTEIAKKLGVSTATMHALIKGEAKSIGPALSGLIELDPHFVTAAVSIIQEADELTKKTVKNSELMELAMKLEAQLKDIKRQIRTK